MPKQTSVAMTEIITLARARVLKMIDDKIIQPESMPYDMFMNELFSIHIKLPRRSGHSTAAISLLEAEGAYLVVPTEDMLKQIYLREWPDKADKIFPAWRAADGLNRQVLAQGHKVRLMIFDPATYIHPKDIETIQHTLSSQRNCFYVYLG